MFSNKEGEKVPWATFNLSATTPAQFITTDDLFYNRRVIVFAVPGAFTYPYSTVHVLGYNSYKNVFSDNGIDDIVCISVNDPFVLARWAKQVGANRIRFIPDISGKFSQSMGMLMSLTDKGMGQRSWRYSMLVEDSVIQKMFVERSGLETWPEVSDAETMLHYINPQAVKPAKALALMQMWRAMLSA